MALKERHDPSNAPVYDKSVAAEPGLDTVPKMLRRWAKETPTRVAVRRKDFGIWQEWTWTDYWRDVVRVGMGLRALGVGRGDVVAIHSENRPEWVFGDIGAEGLGAIVTGIYPTSPASELQYLLANSGAKVLIAEDQEQVDKYLEVADHLPGVQHVIYAEPRGLLAYDHPKLLSWDRLLGLGDDAIAQDGADAYEREVDAGVEDDIACLIYTSGTTGPPKGVMISQYNLVAQQVYARFLFEPRQSDVILSYLPLCHIAEKIYTILIPAASGCEVNFAESVDTVVRDLREISPTLFLGVPRIWEKMQAGIEIRMQDATRLKRALYRAWVKRIGPRIAARARANGGVRRGADVLRYNVGHTLVYRALLDRLGLRRVRSALSGAAPIAPEVLSFFAAIGVPIVEGWGMSETCGLGTLNRLDEVHLGTVGPPAEGIRIRIAEADGEIEVAGPTVFRGYWNLPDKTAESFTDDGYFLTGDVGEWEGGGRGEWDGKSHLKITDRKKDIIITAGGKNISPSEIENSLKTSPYIREAIVVGDKHRFLAALIGIELDTVSNWALRRGLTFTTYRDLTTKPEVLALVQQEVDATNEKFARVESVKKFRLLPKELDHEDGELTATQKVKRTAIAAMFGDLVEEMYR